MLNDLQQRKLAHLFTLLDVDDDGTVDKMDYTASADRLVNAFGFAPGSTESRRVRERYARLWDEVTLPMDADGDERVELKEFTAGFYRFVTQPGTGYHTHIAPVADAFYDLMDTDGDGRITRIEYLRMAESAFRLSEANAAVAFERLDLDGNGSLSRRGAARGQRAVLPQPRPGISRQLAVRPAPRAGLTAVRRSGARSEARPLKARDFQARGGARDFERHAVRLAAACGPRASPPGAPGAGHAAIRPPTPTPAAGPPPSRWPRRPPR